MGDCIQLSYTTIVFSNLHLEPRIKGMAKRQHMHPFATNYNQKQEKKTTLVSLKLNPQFPLDRRM